MQSPPTIFQVCRHTNGYGRALGGEVFGAILARFNYVRTRRVADDRTLFLSGSSVQRRRVGVSVTIVTAMLATSIYSD